MYANLRVQVAPSICALALLVEFLPAMPTLKTHAGSFNSDVSQPKYMANLVALSLYKTFILPKRIGLWLHHDVLMQQEAGDMLPACHYCIAGKMSHFLQARILVDHVFFFFFFGVTGVRFGISPLLQQNCARYCWKT